MAGMGGEYHEGDHHMDNEWNEWNEHDQGHDMGNDMGGDMWSMIAPFLQNADMLCPMFNMIIDESWGMGSGAEWEAGCRQNMAQYVD